METVVLFKENGKMYLTNQKNYLRSIMNKLEINELIGFQSLEEAKEYLNSYFPQYEVIIKI